MNVDLVAVFGIGVMTLATPCVLPLLPIYLGMLLGESVDAAKEKRGRLRLFTATLAFALGFGLVFTLLGLGASTLGGFLQDHRSTLTIVGGVVIVLFGLKFLGFFKVPWLDRELRLPELKTGLRLVDAGLFGVVFALGWTPCVGPILGSVLTYTASRAADPLVGALYLGTYGLGVATPLVVLSLFADRLLPKLQRLNRAIPTLEKVTGGALVLLGVVLALSVAPWSSMVEAADGPLAGYEEQVFIEPALGDPSRRPRVVEFYRQNCHACEQARQTVESLQTDCAGRRIEILAIDAEEPANRELAREYAVSVVPTFVLLDRDGLERRRLVGAPELSDLRGAASALMAETCAGESWDTLDNLEESDGEGGCTNDEDDDPGTSIPGVDEEVCQG